MKEDVDVEETEGVVVIEGVVEVVVVVVVEGAAASNVERRVTCLGNVIREEVRAVTSVGRRDTSAENVPWVGQTNASIAKRKVTFRESAQNLKFQEVGAVVEIEVAGVDVGVGEEVQVEEVDALSVEKRAICRENVLQEGVVEAEIPSVIIVKRWVTCRESVQNLLIEGVEVEEAGVEGEVVTEEGEGVEGVVVGAEASVGVRIRGKILIDGFI